MKMNNNITLILSILLMSSCGYSQEWWKNKQEQNEESKHTLNAGQEKHDSLIVNKQENYKHTSSSDTPINNIGSITYIYDSKIDKIIDFKGTAIPPNNKVLIDGYRVQVSFDQNKDKINGYRAKILEKSSDAETYIKYNAPNFNLFLGNYRTKLEAEAARAKIANDFPESLVVRSKIELPKLAMEE